VGNRAALGIDVAATIDATARMTLGRGARVATMAAMRSAIAVTGARAFRRSPVAEAIGGLTNRPTELEELVAELSGRKPEGVDVRRLGRRGGPDGRVGKRPPAGDSVR
jgi:hypothetical protein